MYLTTHSHWSFTDGSAVVAATTVYRHSPLIWRQRFIDLGPWILLWWFR